MRDLLGEPRPTTMFKDHPDIWEGRFSSDDDRVTLNVMDFASPSSTGANICLPDLHADEMSALGVTLAAKAATAAAAGDSRASQQQTSAVEGGSSSSISGGSSSSSGSWNVTCASTAAADDETLNRDDDGFYGNINNSNDDDDDGNVVCVRLPPYAMRAGPREQIYYDPATVTAAIVTTGNICPGMNDVIEAMAKRLVDYGVPEDQVLGIRYGTRGFTAKDAKPVVLTRPKIDGIHLTGGTILGTSYDHHRVHRHASGYISASDGHSSNGYTTTSSYEESTAHNGGNSGAAADDQQSSDELEAILHKLEFWRINHFFVIGGQGGNQLAAQLAEGCKQRKVPCCIVGVPKSVDNDVMLVDKTFGFDTVVQEVVQRPLLAAKTEAASARKGVGLVKVFGRRSGWIALQASLASGVVDVCLIPEEPFEMQGPAGVLEYIKALIEKKGHAVLCVAEGAGQDLLYPEDEPIPVDDAGNPLLRDIGAALKKGIKAVIPDADVKYIDPTYMVQAVPSNSQDHIYCRILGFHAVDAAFAGYTGVMVGQVNGHFVLLPSAVVTQSARRVDPSGKSWNRLRAAIGQPRFQNSKTVDMPVSAASQAY
eukprot:GHRR01019893.1.p1 GENE.GHRR01019893.1~~GHRR01019893.1.p1  ORF type:complete len:596 (+),score=208.92 GHRR01019893.1:424-2211(+)